MGIPFPGYDIPETWSIADVDVTTWKHINGLTFSLLPKGKILVVAPLEQQRVRLISNTEDSVQALCLDIEINNIRRAGKFNLWIRQIDQYRHSRVFLAGDAAHCHSPVGGRGMNLGIADGVCLARCIRSGQLDDYNSERHPDGSSTIKASEKARKFIASENPFFLFGLIGFATLMGNSKFLRQKVALALTQS